MNRGFSWNTILWGPKSITLLLESELLQGAKYTIMKTNKFWEITQEENTTFETGVAGYQSVEALINGLVLQK